MIEKDLIKHTKKTFSIFKSSGKNIKEKVTEILVEIFIIIIAVTISIWLHNWSQKQHDRKEEKEFLTGLRNDMQNNIDNMKSSKAFYAQSLKGLNYFTSQINKSIVNKDSVNYYYGLFFNSTNLDPYIGRYEGLKNSGGFKIIENKELLNDIINLHETTIKRIEYLNEMYFQHNKRLENLISQKIKFNNKGEIVNVTEIITNSEFQVLLMTSKGIISNNIVPVHNEGIKECGEIINLIDIELH